MSSFLDDLREFLRHPVALPIGDERRYRAYFLKLLERAEKEGSSDRGLNVLDRTVGQKLDVLVEGFERQLWLEGVETEKISTLVEIALARECDFHAPAPSRMYELLIKNLTSPDYGDKKAPAPWWRVSRYANEIRAVREQDGGIERTDIGRIILELPGIEAIKWLLHVETALATGPDDPWRVDRETLRRLTRFPRRVGPEEWWIDYGPRLPWTNLHRLAALGLLSMIDEVDEQYGSAYGYKVHDHAIPIFREIADGADSPMAVLVASMLQDEVQKPLGGPSTPSSLEATVRQTHLVVHEIRNALLPIHTALSRIYREAERAGIKPEITRYSERVDRNIERLRTFADTLLHTARLGGQIREVFDLVSTVQEAVGVLTSEGKTLSVTLGDRRPSVVGIRADLLLALINLLRNAFQAAPPDQPRVAIELTTEPGRARILIDDNGPGVELAEREKIFVEGYSSRPGSSGHGLALARATIEDNMNGTIDYEDNSSLGGARFVVTLPTHNGSAR